jgi:hypothetical protein
MTTEQCFVIPEDATDVQAATPAADTPAQPEAKTSALPDNKTLAAFGLFILLAGGGSVAVRITYGELAPFYSGAARFVLAGLIFWVLLFLRKIPFPRGQALLGAALFGWISVHFYSLGVGGDTCQYLPGAHGTRPTADHLPRFSAWR